MPFDARTYESDKALAYTDRSAENKMTRRHFEAIARTLRERRPNEKSGAVYRQWRETVEAFAAMCADSNPHFVSAAFYRAAGVT